MDTIPEIFDRSGKSNAEISEAAGIEPSRLIELKSGADPNLAELHDLALALGISPSEFLPATELRRKIGLLFSQNRPSIKPSQVPAVETLSERIERLLELITPIPGPEWPKRFRGAHSTYEDAVKDADTFREVFFDGDMVEPLLNLPAIAVEKLGVILSVMRYPRVDGASAVVDGVPFVFVSPGFPPRMLFSVALQLGHIVAHKPGSGDFASFDPINLFGGIRKPQRQAEKYADAFASNLLLPARGVGIALKKVREIYRIRQDAVGDTEILYLGRFFGVSFPVAARRCEELELLPPGGALSVYDELRKQHASPEKRADQLGLPPRSEIDIPALPRQVVEGAIEKIKIGQVSIGRASESLNIPIESIMELHCKMNIDHPV